MKKKILQSKRWPKPKGPYSVAVAFNHLLFISGQGPAYADTGEIVKGDFNEQARVVFENLRMILEDAGSSFEHVLKTKFPRNRFIKDKIRQQLQVLRDRGLLEFSGKGRYRKLS